MMMYKFYSDHPDALDRFNRECCECIQQLSATSNNIFEAVNAVGIPCSEAFYESFEKEKRRQSRVILHMLECVNMGYVDITEKEIYIFEKTVVKLGWNWHKPFTLFRER